MESLVRYRKRVLYLESVVSLCRARFRIQITCLDSLEKSYVGGIMLHLCLVTHESGREDSDKLRRSACYVQPEQRSQCSESAVAGQCLQICLLRE